jgi:hypothetical protein
MLLPCSRRGRVGGGHNDGNKNRDDDDRRIIPQSVDGAHGGQLRDQGGRRRGAVPWNGWLLVASHYYFIQLKMFLISFSFLFFLPFSFFTISLENCVQLDAHCTFIVCVLLCVSHNAT